ncbi:MAG: class I SAM-dependent methyltransferase [Nocardioides sp.]|uniref:O-methyltransferase n=1 Tax=Nocardioides sp. TaxID=35761 RepID=UPI0039E6F809
MSADVIQRLALRSAAIGFEASSTDAVGDLLAALVASKPGGRILELGTGTGLGTVRLLQGMDPTAHLVTIELDATLSAIAREEIHDERIEWIIGDAGEWLAGRSDEFDLIFADTWPGKFTHLEEALGLVKSGGFYVVDDLRSQPDWPADHQAAVDDLVATLSRRPDWITAHLDAASGVMVCVRL